MKINIECTEKEIAEILTLTTKEKRLNDNQKTVSVKIDIEGIDGVQVKADKLVTTLKDLPSWLK